METIDNLSEYKYVGNGFLSLLGNKNGIKFSSNVSSFQFEGQADSIIHCSCPVDAYAFSQSGFPIWDDHNFKQSFKLEFKGECKDGKIIIVKDEHAIVNGNYGMNKGKGEFCTLKYYSESACITSENKHETHEVQSIRYMLTNCPFFIPFGDRTITGDTQHAVSRISIITDVLKIDIRCFNARLTNGSSGITSTLTLTPLVQTEIIRCDFLADSICQILTLAQRNTVDWIAREEIDNTGQIFRIYLRNADLLPYQSACTLIPYDSLKKFIEGSLAYYIVNQRDKHLKRTVRFLVEAEHHPVVDVKYALIYMAFECLRVNWLPKIAKTGELISKNYIQEINDSLGTEIIEMIEERLNISVNDDKRGRIIGKLKDANEPVLTAKEAIDRFLSSFSLEGQSAKLSKLRSSLYHRGSIGNLLYREVGELFIELADIVVVALLKALKYSGQYIPHDKSKLEKRPLPFGDFKEIG